MFSGNRRSAAQFFFLFLKHCHLNMSLKYSKLNSGFQDKSMAKECQMAVETFVFLNNKVSRRKNRNGMLYPSSLDYTKLFKVAGVMSSHSCVNPKWGVGADYYSIKNSFRIVLIPVFIIKKMFGGIDESLLKAVPVCSM